MTPDKILRRQIAENLRGGRACMSFEDAIANFPLDRINDRVPNAPYRVWHIIEHMRIAQWDLLDTIRNADYRPLQWPQDYWPRPDDEAGATRWTQAINDFLADRDRLVQIALDPATDLTAPLPHHATHSILRQLLLAADHNAYHIGEFAALRQVMGTWSEGR